MPDDQPVRRLRRAAAAVHPRLRPRLRPLRAQDHGHGAGRPGAQGARAGRAGGLPGAGRGVRALPLRQRGGLGLRAAPEAAALSRLPVGAATHPLAAPAPRPGPPGGRGMTSPMQDEGYNFAYLDEQTKRMIRRCILKAVAVPGYQVPFGGREMPLPYGWGTAGMQVTATIIGRDDTLKVIDQGADDTTNAVNIRRFFARVEIGRAHV